MKKLALITAAAMILLAPMSSFALEAMSANSMKSATGQAGVSIAIDDVILYQNTGDTTYVDNDEGAGINLSGNESLLFINALINGNDGVAGNNYATILTDANVTGFTTFAAKPLTIDVGTCPDLTAIAGVGATIGGVIIGLPTLEIYDALADSSQVISLVDGDTAYTNADHEFIEIQQTGNTLAILGGTLEIAPH